LKYVDLTGYAAESPNPTGQKEEKIVAEKNPAAQNYRNQGKWIHYDNIVSNETLINSNSRVGHDLQEMARIAKEPSAMEQVYYDAAHGNRKAQWLVAQFEGVATGIGAQIARELNSLDSLVISKEVNQEKIPFSAETASGKKLLGLMAKGYEKEARRLHFRNEVIGYTFMLLMAGGVAKSALATETNIASIKSPPVVNGAIPRPQDCPYYSVAIEAKLKPGTYIASDATHIRQANRQLYEQMRADLRFAGKMESEYPGITKHVTPGPKGGVADTPPPGLTWHHVADQPGKLQLVPRGQHQSPGPVQQSLHPQGAGGKKNWGGGRTRPTLK